MTHKIRTKIQFLPARGRFAVAKEALDDKQKTTKCQILRFALDDTEKEALDDTNSYA